MPDLDERLAATRTRLLDDIDVPDLGPIRRRAAVLRRRRLAGRTGGALLALAVAGVLALQPWGGDTRPPPPAATPRPTPQPADVYTGAGLTVHGLLRDTAVAEVPGDLRDVEFADPDRGWVLAANCAPQAATCELAVARTTDGGLTWTTFPVPGSRTGQADVPDLVALDASTLVLHGNRQSMISLDGGSSWRSEPSGGRTATLDGTARPLLRSGQGAGCAGAVVEVWSPGYGYRGDLANQPPLNPCWVAARRTADGGWWVGGTAPDTGTPAAAVTHDGGVTWERREFEGPGDSVRVTALGDHTYAAVVTGDGEATVLRALYHSARPGGPFGQTWRAGGAPQTIGGEPVPLLDGRLLMADGQGHWLVSDDEGLTFRPVDGLPHVSRLQRTPGGYVAFDMVAVGYAGVSPDGSRWRKLQVH